MTKRADHYHLALGANEAAADANDPEAGGVVLGASATLVSRRMKVTSKEHLSLYLRVTGTGTFTVNVNGTPLAIDDRLTANAPIAPLTNNPQDTGIVTGETWVFIDTNVTPFIQVELVETGGVNPVTIQDAWLVAQ